MAYVMQRADVGMIQAGDGFCFALESLAQFSSVREMNGKNFNGDNSIEAGIAGFVNFAHSARANRTGDFVRPEFGPGCESHLFSFAAQFRMTDMDCVSACLTCVRIRNRWLSRLTS